MSENNQHQERRKTPQGPGRTAPGPGGINSSRIMLFYLAMFFILLIWIAYSYYAAEGAPEEINYSTFKSEVRNGNVEEVTVQGERITGIIGICNPYK